jgi:hypothetical protein
MDISGIPVSIFDESYIPGQLLPKYTAHRYMTLTSTNNKLYFKYINIPNAMTITKNASDTSIFSVGSMFVHTFIHQLETDLLIDISLNAYTEPDTLEISNDDPITTTNINYNTNTSITDLGSGNTEIRSPLFYYKRLSKMANTGSR